MSLIPCYATTAPGLERLLIAELTALGLVVGAAEVGGVDFEATPDKLADALLWLRTANRVTVRLASFAGRTFGELERHASAIDWSRVAPPGTTVHFRITSKKSRLYHEDAIAERLEKAVLSSGDHLSVVRQPKAAEELEADVSVAPAVQRIVVRLHRDQVSISADASGGLLHRRGWRKEVAKAPLRETLAAAMLLGIEWGGAAGEAGHAAVPLHDPFCGSGTIPIEAALLARRMAPGRGRRFAAESWPEFGTEFSAARARATRVELARSPVLISGSDRDHGAIDAALANAERAGVSADVEFSRATVSDLVADTSRGWLVGNPPYGSRVGEKQELRSLYAKLGNVLQSRRPNWRLALLVNDPMLAGQVGVEFEEIWRTTNGGIAVKLVAS